MLLRSSSFSTFKVCPRKAYYAYILGLVKKNGFNIDLFFGSIIHDAVDVFNKTGDIEDALNLLEQSDWFHYHSKKNKFVALTLLKLYARFISGHSIETSEEEFTFDVGNHIWKGKFDSLYKPSNSTYVGEVKTTNRWFLHTDPNDQFISYYIGAKRKYPRLQGVYIFNFDPEKVDVGGTIFVPSQFKIDEWLEETKVAADYFQLCIDKETFPKNPAGCFIYGKQYPCDFLDLCTSNDYGTRQAIIKNNFVVNEEAVNLSW